MDGSSWYIIVFVVAVAFVVVIVVVFVVNFVVVNSAKALVFMKEMFSNLGICGKGTYLTSPPCKKMNRVNQGRKKHITVVPVVLRKVSKL